MEPNLKTRVLDVATGNFASPSIPVPTGHMWDSIMRVVSGLFLGIVLGVPLGLLFDMIMRWVIDRTIPWRGKG